MGEKKKGIEIRNNTIENCKVGISVPKDADVNISDNDIKRCKKAIEIRDFPTIIQLLNLPSDTPHDLLDEALEILSSSKFESSEEMKSKFSKTGLYDWLLKKGAEIATIVGCLYQVFH